MCDIAALCHFHVHGRFNLFGKVLTVLLIDNVPECNIYASSSAHIISTVIMVINGNKSDPKKGENVFQIIADL